MDNKIIYLIEARCGIRWSLENGVYHTDAQAEEVISRRAFPLDYRIVPFMSQRPAPEPPCQSKRDRYCFEYKDGRPKLHDLKLVFVLDLLAGGARGSVTLEDCD